MIRANVDLVAVVVLIAGAMVCSAAKKFELQQIFANRTLIVQRRAYGPTVKLVNIVPVLPCARD